MSERGLIGRAALSALALAGGLWLADILNPNPMPLGGAAVLGWIAFWSSCRRWRFRGLGWGY